MFNDIYKGKKVLITGHTGFKGSWLTQWLHKLGAKVYGFSDDVKKHYKLLHENINFEEQFEEEFNCDITIYKHIQNAINHIQPDIIFHLCAQPIVSYGYSHAYYTYNVNTFGTLNLLEAVRRFNDTIPIVCILTDKIYKNKESFYGYREIDELGGFDPYSNSKSCAENIIETYRHCYDMNIASCASGNVIGGGDFGEDRLIPDIIRAVENKETLLIRNENSVRPWMFVLDTLCGYLKVGQKLLDSEDIKKYCTLFNFGPSDHDDLKVRYIVEDFKVSFNFNCTYSNSSKIKETNVLTLDSTKANKILRWRPLYSQDISLLLTKIWYIEYFKNSIMTMHQINEYTREYSRRIEE